MITTGKRFHVLPIATHNTDMTKIAETEIKTTETHLIESGTEVKAETPNTKRKGGCIVKLFA
jgi:hypothetical protein